MSEWTAPESGWYEFRSGQEPRRLTDAEVSAAEKLEKVRGRAESVTTGADRGDYGNGQVAFAMEVLEIIGEDHG